MKTLRLFLTLMVFATSALAVDTTPPTLTITRTWIEKAGTRSNFNMLLDPQDETGLEAMDPLGAPGATGTIWFRSELTNDPVPDSKVWKMMPWTRGQPFSLGFTCTKCVIEIRAKDAAGNFSPIQRRVFTAPFPYTSAPVTSIKLRDATATNFPGPALDCRGLFAGEVDGVGLSGDIIQVDRTSGDVMVRRQTGFPFTNSNVLSFSPNSIEDSAAADYDKDGRLDLVLVVNGALRLYHNDGLVSNVLTFTEVTIAPVAINGLGMTTMNNVCFGDLSGEGKPEIFVSGTDSGGAARVGWLHNNAVNVFGSANNALAPTGASAGKVAMGDVTGDGRLDLAMMDAAGLQVIVFKNDDNARLVGDDDVDTSKRPVSTAISDGRPDIRAKSLAVGDVTGDGRADAVVLLSWWGSSNPLDINDNHTHEYWQLLDSLGDSGLRAQYMQSYSTGPLSATEETFASDVIIRDLNGDRFPEVIMTSQFQADLLGSDDPDNHPEKIPARGPGIRALQFFPQLDEQNRLSLLDYQDVERVQIASTTNPHRLVAAPFNGNRLADVWVACNDSTTPFGWVGNSSGSGTTAALAVLGGASTQNDPNGSDGPNGTVTYFVYPGNYVNYQLTYINNSTSTLTNATMDCVLPKNVTVETQDGASLITAKTTQTLRWTLATIAAGETGTKNFRVRVLATSNIGLLRPKNLIKAGTKTASSYMPNVTIDEPATFELLSVTSDSDPTGAIVHYGEGITYRMRLTNRGDNDVNDAVISMPIPANTIFDGPVTAIPGTTLMLSPGNKKIDFIVTSLAPGAHQDVFVNVEARGADNSLINNSAITAQRPGGLKRTIPPVKTTIKPAIDVSWYSVYSSSAPSDQSGGEPLLGTTVHFGESIRYRLKLINRSTIAQLNVKVGMAVPTNTTFDGPVSDPPGMTLVIGPGNKRVDFTIANFPGSTYNPDGSINTLSINTNARLDVEDRMDLDLNTKLDDIDIVQNSVTVQVPGRAVVKPDPYTFQSLRSLELTVRTDPANLTNVKPGGTITYELQAHNYGADPVTSAKVVNAIPEATQILSAQQDDGTGTASPFRSGNFIGNDQAAVALTASSKPAYILTDRLLVWDLGQVEPGAIKTMRYKVKVATDLESAYFVKGVPVSINLLNVLYNFAGTAHTGKRIFSFLPLSVSAAQAADADPFLMLCDLGNAPYVSVPIDTTAPLPKPQLVLNKHAVGQRISPEPAPPAEPYAVLPVHQEDDDFIFDVDNDSTKVNDALFNYVLRYTNNGGAPATNVRVKDVLPTDTIFVGFLAKDNALVSSYAYSHFYDAAGKELDMNIGTNTTKVRSFDLYAGDLAIGESHAFTYQVLVPDSVKVGTIITSTRGGVLGVKNGLDYTAAPGFQLGADELHFPVNGGANSGAESVKVKITQTANFVLLMPRGFKSASGVAAAAPAPAPRFESAGDVMTMSSDEPDGLMLTMPYDVRGDAGAAPLPPLSNMKMTFTIPKGYMTDDAYVNSENNVKLKTLNASATVEGSGYVSAIRQADGKIKVSFPLDDVPFAWPTAHITFDPLYKSTLVDAVGNTKAPAYIDVSITGNYNGTKVIPEVKSQVRIDSRANSAKDSKVFVGRCAPISVKRGDTFSYTIFVGNLTDHVFLSSGSITMKVPTGCDFVSASDYKYNYFIGAGPLLSDSTDHRAQGTYTASTRTVTWPIRGMNNSEGGAVTLTVKVQENFSGDRIDDKSCLLKVGNAMPKSPGPQSVVVRAGDEDGQFAEITQRWLQGAKIKHNDGVTTELKKNFLVNEESCGISIGGADVLQMMNGVNFIPLPNDRVMLVGPPSKVVDAAGGVVVDRHVLDNSMMRIVVGPGTSGDVSLINVPGYTAGVVPANQILTDLGVPGLNILAAKGANILVGNGGNLVRAGASDFTKAGLNGLDAPALILPGGSALLISNMNDAKLIGQSGSTIVAGGGGNAVTGEGGKVIAPGPAGVVANDGAGVIGQSGSALIGHDGSTLIGHDGSTLIGHDGSTLIGKGGAGVIANDGAGLIGQDGAAIVAGGGGNATQVGNGNR